MSVPGLKADTRTPLKQARNWGSSKAGVGHWWVQRLTAAALIVLGLWFVATVLIMLGADYATARHALAEPWNMVLMILFVAIGFWHGQLGLQVIIEDYVHTRWLEMTLIVIVKFIAVLLSLACALAVLRVGFGG
jgi:succinate dehydrogenase / fumarate reductase membrane anchor subunit